MKKSGLTTIPECSHNLLAVQDTLNVLSGKWIVPIISKLRLDGDLLFNELIDNIPGISSKVLTSTLREMENNLIIARTVMNTKPVKVMYSLTGYGQTLEKVIFDMLDWGLSHRQKIIGRNNLPTSTSAYTEHLKSELPVR